MDTFHQLKSILENNGYHHQNMLLGVVPFSDKEIESLRQYVHQFPQDSDFPITYSQALPGGQGIQFQLLLKMNDRAGLYYIQNVEARIFANALDLEQELFSIYRVYPEELSAISIIETISRELQLRNAANLLGGMSQTNNCKIKYRG